MREILFRGKRTDNGEWIYGDLLQIPAHDFCSIMGQTSCSENKAVIPETVGQYTGLTDKNGTKIFEGDLVCTQYIDPIFKSTFSDNIDYEERHEVKFEDGCFYVEVKEKIDLMITAFRGKIEIVSNIHDNPELMEV